MSELTPVLELRGISKGFVGVQALDDVSFELHRGEVHILLGENGAGKSTLMKILCGAYKTDAGEFFYEGKAVKIAKPTDAKTYGIAVIFQEFTLVPHLSVAQNIFLGREAKGRWTGLLDQASMRSQAQQILDELDMAIDPDAELVSLGVAQQQMVEIAKALSQNAQILVLDEPTASLSDKETAKLFEMIAKLKSRGVAMVYISHRMAEVFSIGDRITVLRDGRKVASRFPAETNQDELVSLMVGKRVDLAYARTFEAQASQLALQVENLHSPSGVKGVSLEVRVGEIVGLAGLVGSGRTELARAIFGADPVSSGSVKIFGQLQDGGPLRAIELGAALIPESRKSQGLALILSCAHNVTMASLKRLFPSGWFVPSKNLEQSIALIKRLRVATPGAHQLVQFLSGGNQQKIVISKWLSAEARFFIFDEPTRGIDVGAKAEIFSLIDGLVKQGAAVLMISSELSEIVKVCDRAYVMRDGHIAGELKRQEISEESILALGVQDARG